MAGFRILIVDDDAQIRRVSSLAFRAAGWHVVEAENGLQALDMVTQESFDAIIIDCMMPVMGGLAAVKEIRKLPGTQNIPIVGLSATPSTLDDCLADRNERVASKASPGG